MMNIEEHPNFCEIDYPTLDCSCCDLLIATDNVELILPWMGEESHSVSGNLHATRTRVGWNIAGSHII